MLDLKDDRFFLYAGAPTLVDVLANDIVPADFTLTPPPDSSSGPSYRVAGGFLEVSGDAPLGFYSSGDYTVTDNTTGQSASATISYTLLSGTPGIGGFTFAIPDFTEDDGIITLDVKALVDPQGINTYVSSFSDDIFTSFTTSFVGFDAELRNGVLTFDADQFAYLDDGESENVTLTFGASNGTQSAFSKVTFTAIGITDSISVINNASPNGAMNGTGGNDRIVSVLNQDNVLFGDRGADTFVFGADFFDGNSDEETIKDFKFSQDEIEFADGTEIFLQFEFQNGVMLVLDGGSDVVFVHGDDLSLNNIDMSGHVFKAPDPTTGVGSGNYDPVYNQLYLLQLQSVNQTFNFANGWTPDSPFSWADAQGWSIG